MLRSSGLRLVMVERFMTDNGGVMGGRWLTVPSGGSPFAPPNFRTPNEVALEEQVDDLKRRNRDLQTRATHWEGAARDLARTVAALQMLYATASARLDAIIADVALENLEPEPFRPNVSPIGGRRLK